MPRSDWRFAFDGLQQCRTLAVLVMIMVITDVGRHVLTKVDFIQGAHAIGFAFFDETLTGKLRGKEPRATVEAVRMGKKMMFAASTKAERDLGFQVLPVYTALRAAINWFIAHGYAPPFNRQPA